MRARRAIASIRGGARARVRPSLQAPPVWSLGYGNGTFVRNHAQVIIACDFCVVVTATFRLLYVFVVMEHATRRVLSYQGDGTSHGALDAAATAGGHSG